MEKRDESGSPLLGDGEGESKRRCTICRLLGCTVPLIVALFVVFMCFPDLFKQLVETVDETGAALFNETAVTSEQRLAKDPLQRPAIQTELTSNSTQAKTTSTATTVDSNNKSWDILGITVNWPESSCRQMNRSHHICHEPKNLDDWTIHGLWPNRLDGSWPQYCTKEKFNPDLIEDLLPAMEEHWPNLMTDRPKYDFWTHEYQKHGTCAESLEALSTEHKYFDKTLETWQQMNIKKNLENYAYPSQDKTFNVTDFIDGFGKITDGHSCEIKCAEGDLSEPYEDIKVQFILEVMCCMDKEFNFIDCPNTVNNFNPLAHYQEDLNPPNPGEYPNIPVRPCRADIPIAYPLISHL